MRTRGCESHRHRATDRTWRIIESPLVRGEKPGSSSRFWTRVHNACSRKLSEPPRSEMQRTHLSTTSIALCYPVQLKVKVGSKVLYRSNIGFMWGSRKLRVGNSSEGMFHVVRLLWIVFHVVRGALCRCSLLALCLKKNKIKLAQSN